MKDAAQLFLHSARTTLRDVAGLEFVKARDVAPRAWNVALCRPLVECIRRVEVTVGARMRSQVAEHYEASAAATVLRPITRPPYVVFAVGGDDRCVAIAPRDARPQRHAGARHWGTRNPRDVASRFTNSGPQRGGGARGGQDDAADGHTDAESIPADAVRLSLTDTAVYLVRADPDTTVLHLAPGAECVLVWLSVEPAARSDEAVLMPLHDQAWEHGKTTEVCTAAAPAVAQPWDAVGTARHSPDAHVGAASSPSLRAQRHALGDDALRRAMHGGRLWFARHALGTAALQWRVGRGGGGTSAVIAHITAIAAPTPHGSGPHVGFWDALAPLLRAMTERGAHDAPLYAAIAGLVVGGGTRPHVPLPPHVAAGLPTALRGAIAGALLHRLASDAAARAREEDGGGIPAPASTPHAAAAAALCADVCVLSRGQWATALPEAALPGTLGVPLALRLLITAHTPGRADEATRMRLADAVVRQGGYTAEVWCLQGLAAVPPGHEVHRHMLRDGASGLRGVLARGSGGDTTINDLARYLRVAARVEDATRERMADAAGEKEGSPVPEHVLLACHAHVVDAVLQCGPAAAADAAWVCSAYHRYLRYPDAATRDIVDALTRAGLPLPPALVHERQGALRLAMA